MTIKEFEIQYALGSMSHKMLMRLAGFDKTSKKILVVLSKDPAGGVRYWAASNPNTPEEVLKMLSKDKERYIKYEAVKTLKCLRE